MDFDLLFSDDSVQISESFLDDILMPEIQKHIFGENRSLANAFRKVIAFPLTNKKAIEKRQAILREFLLHRDWLESIISVLRNAKDIQRENRKNLYQKIDADQRLRMNLAAVLSQLAAVDDLGNLFKGQNFFAEDLEKIQIYFSKTDLFKKMKKDLIETVALLESKQYLAGNISFNDQIKFKALSLTDVKNKSVVQRWWKKIECETSNEDQILFSDNKAIERCLMQIYEKVTYHFCGVLSGIYTFFKSLFLGLYNQLEFYQSAVIYMVYLEQHGFRYCFPEIMNEPKTIRADGMYLLPLALANGKQMSGNDFSTESDSIFIITGYNRGGKTTFLRTIGLNQVLTQAGVAVPAKRYMCSVFNNIVGHFPKNEDQDLKHGMFEKEIAELQRDLATVSTEALVLMNESFSSTTEDEGIKVARDVIMALAETDSTVFFVTHFYNLANDIDVLNTAMNHATKAVNLVTAVYEKPSQRENYEIIRGKPLPTYNINLSDFI